MLLLENQWCEKGLNVEMELDSITYTQNPEILSHVWTNLLSNAVKFTPPEGSITVLCREEPDRIRVTVTDTGIGMDKETMSHMFDKFYQGDPSRKLSGNGLGLSLVRRITDMVGASLLYESEVGKGTSFTVLLPK
jgi:signal transduction histidine kinase